MFQKKTSTHIIGYKLENSCLILIIFWHRSSSPPPTRSMSHWIHAPTRGRRRCTLPSQLGWLVSVVSRDRKQTLAYFEGHRTLLPASICRCFEFVEQCFMSKSILTCAKETYHVIASEPSTHWLYDACNSNRVLYRNSLTSVNSAFKRLNVWRFKKQFTPTHICNAQLTIITRSSANAKRTARPLHKY